MNKMKQLAAACGVLVAFAGVASAKGLPPKNVTMYTVEGEQCLVCDSFGYWFEQNIQPQYPNVGLVEKDVEDDAIMNELLAVLAAEGKTFNALPVLMIGDEVQVGYDPIEIRRAMAETYDSTFVMPASARFGSSTGIVQGQKRMNQYEGRKRMGSAASPTARTKTNRRLDHETLMFHLNRSRPRYHGSRSALQQRMWERLTKREKLSELSE